MAGLLGLSGGTLGALNQGLSSFFNSYNSAKKSEQERVKDQEELALKKMQAKYMAAEKGLMENPDKPGEFILTPQATAEKDMERRYKEAQIAALGKKGEKDPLSSALAFERLAKMKEDAKKAEFDKTPAGKMEKGGAELKNKLGMIGSGLESLTKYEDAFNKGDRQGRITPQTPILGMLKSSTPIDEQRLQMEEAIGRLASGGAIGKEEEGRFRQMIPTAADSDEAAKRKMQGLREMFETKMKFFGFEPNQLGDMGFDASKYGYGNTHSQGLMNQKPGLMNQQNSNATGKPDLNSLSDDELYKVWSAKQGKK